MAEVLTLPAIQDSKLKAQSSLVKHQKSWWKNGKGKNILAPLTRRSNRVAPMAAHCPGPLHLVGETAPTSAARPTPTFKLPPASYHFKDPVARDTLTSINRRLWARRLPPLRPRIMPANSSSYTEEDSSGSALKTCPGSLCLHKPWPLGRPKDNIQGKPKESQRNAISDKRSTLIGQAGSTGKSGNTSWMEPVIYLTNHPFFVSSSLCSTNDVDKTEAKVDQDDVSALSGAVRSPLSSNQSSKCIDDVAPSIHQPRASTDALVRGCAPAIKEESVLEDSCDVEDAEPAVATESIATDSTSEEPNQPVTPKFSTMTSKLFRSFCKHFREVFVCFRRSN